MYFVYILRSTLIKRFYIGFTLNIERRIKEHNSGKTRSTKAYRPWELFFKENYNSLAEARNREKYLKSGIGREFIYNKWLRSITE